MNLQRYRASFPVSSIEAHGHSTFGGGWSQLCRSTFPPHDGLQFLYRSVIQRVQHEFVFGWCRSFYVKATRRLLSTAWRPWSPLSDISPSISTRGLWINIENTRWSEIDSARDLPIIAQACRLSQKTVLARMTDGDCSIGNLVPPLLLTTIECNLGVPFILQIFVKSRCHKFHLTSLFTWTKTGFGASKSGKQKPRKVVLPESFGREAVFRESADSHASRQSAISRSLVTAERETLHPDAEQCSFSPKCSTLC
jgi:hypothetical protein